MKLCRTLIIFNIAMVGLTSCSSSPAVRSQEYAALPTQKVLEFDFESVWKGIETSLHDIKVTDRDPSSVEPLEWQKISKRALETDWIYTQSRDKYQEYRVNGLPKKQFLPIRVKYKIKAKRVLGGTDVSIDTQEEYERLNIDGTTAGYSKADQIDTSRPHDLLEKIRLNILSAHP